MMSSLEADPADNRLDEARDLTLGLLTVGTETVAVDIAALAEVARIETLRPTLEPHPGVLGLISIRGALTPVYDPFGTFAAETGRRPGIAAILHRRGTAIGLAVDGVQGLSRFPAAKLQRIKGRFGQGLGRGRILDGARMIHVLDTDALFADPDVPRVTIGARSEHRTARAAARPYLTFEAGGVHFAVQARNIFGTVPRQAIEDATLADDVYLGSITYFGRRVPIVGANQVFGLGQTPRADTFETVVLRFPGDRLLGLAVERICHVALPNEAAIAPLPLHLGSGMALLRGSVTIAGREHFVVHETHLHDVDMLRITADLSADNNQTEPGDGVEPPTALAEAATGKVRRERERYVLAKAGTDIALRLSDIAAMREPPADHEITPCPNTTPGLEGIVFLDGRVTPLIRLSAYLGMTASEDTGRARVLVIDKDTLRIGLLVEDIEGIATSTWFAHQDAAVSGGFDLVAVRVAGQIAVRNCLDLPALAGRLATDWDHAATPELLPSLAASDTAERQA